MKHIFVGAVVIGAWLTAAGAAEVEVTVAGDRVNLRARPSLESEVVGQVADGRKLRAKNVGDEWVEVIPPEDMDLWAHRDFVRDGEVQATPLNIRAGAGINYNVVGALRKGDRVTVRGEFQEWLKIAPPEETSLWVSRSLVKTAGQREKPSARPAAPAAVAPPIPAPSPAAAARPPPSAAPAAAAALVAPPPSWRLDDRQPQGRRVQREGVVKPAGFLFGRPTRYQLGGQGDRRADTYGYLYGNEEQLKSLEGRVIRLRGREYWLHNTKLPVVIVDQLAPP